MTLPQGWAEATIGEIADTRLGKMLDAAKNKGEPLPYLRNINVRWGSFDLSDLLTMKVKPDELAELAVRDGDLFVCEGGEPGRAAVWRGGEQRIVFQKALHRVRTLDGVQPDFVARYLGHAAANATFADLLTGTTIKHLPQVALQRIPINVPPSPEQRRIVAKLDALTARLARARAELDRVPVLAERMRDAAYRRAFASTNLVPLEQLTPGDAPIIYGILQPGPDLPDGVPYVRPSEIDRGTIKLDEVRRTSSEIAYRFRRAALREGDIILTIVGTIGKVAIVPRELNGGNITQSSCRIRPDTTQVKTAYLRHWLRSPSAWRQYDANRLGTAVPRLNIRDIRAFKVPLPSVTDQERVAALLDAEEARYLRATQEAARARALLDRLEAAILARAFRGELVPQDPADEPATALLARIRAQRESAPKAKRGRRIKEKAGA